MIVLTADKKDINDIHKIASSYDLSNGARHERGFLVSSYSDKDYYGFLEDEKKEMYVLIEENEVIGFVYGYYVIDAPVSKSSDCIKSHADVHDYVIKQICIKKDAPKGAGTFLMNQMFYLINGDIYLAIVAKPLNVTSLVFHKKLGFNEVDRVLEDDGLERIILSTFSTEGLEVKAELNKSQYQTAVDLYKHEDQLTWTKFNFSIITNGAIMSILIPNLNSGFNKPLFIILVAIVIIINLGYIYTIRNGRMYLKNRKTSAMELESTLEKLGVMNVITPAKDENKNGKNLLDSTTKYVQYLIPIIFCIGWITILIIFLLS